MAIYHLSIKAISRSTGRSSTAAAAYRAGEKIVDLRTGEIHDYSRKAGVAESGIVVPAGSAWTPSRSELWNAVEVAEKRKDSCVAREHEIALPHELDERQRLALVKTYVQDLADRHRCAVDFAIHAPGKGEGGKDLNWHAHVLCTTRQVNGHGLGQKCEREKSGRDRKADLEFERQRWAATANQALEKSGIEARIDHRSLEAQGIERMPTSHLGPAVAGMARRGASSHVLARIQAEAGARLQVAKMIGELQRNQKILELGLIDLSRDIALAKAERDRQKPESYYSPRNVAARAAAASEAGNLPVRAAVRDVGNLADRLAARTADRIAAARPEPLSSKPTPAQPEPAPTPRPQNEALLALVQQLIAKGKEVRKPKNDTAYLGPITSIEDGRYAVQNLGRNWVTIHELARLEGKYVVGQSCEIRYRDGRGTDKKQDAKELERSRSKGPGHGR